MAIQNASDLLVYIKTGIAIKQTTRIKVLTTAPFSSTGSVKINNVTSASGEVSDDVSTGSTSTNTGAALVGIIGTKLGESSNGYNVGTADTQGDYTYIDVINGATGIVPTLEVINGTGVLKQNAVIIEIITPGSSNIFDPVAFSTSASFSTNTDLIDVTTKDSEGCSESVSGLKSFEISTELLQNLNPDHPIDGTDFYQKLVKGSTYNISFSDRIINVLLTNLTTAGVDNFTKAADLTQTAGQSDPFGGTTASKLLTPSSTSSKYLRYTIAAARVEDNKVTWSFYVKGFGSTTKASFTPNNHPSSPAPVVTKLSGPGTIAIQGGNYVISDLTTSDWSRVEVSLDTLGMSGQSDLEFYLYPGLFSSQNSDAIITSSWQIELKGKATDYQDPTKVSRWQGDAFVTSIDFDAGVEDNFTCSATFTGTATNTYNT